MIVSIPRLVCGAIVVLVLSITECPAAPDEKADSAAIAEATGAQQAMALPVRVVGPDGKPVVKAKITPWALRSSQGHGWWRKDDDDPAKILPKEVFTDASGIAQVHYPYFRNVQERIRTTSVSLYIDHPGFAYVDELHIDVPLESGAPHEVVLTAGIPLDVRPLIDGEPAELENLFAIWSDGRSWQKDVVLEETTDGILRIPAIRPGKNSLMLVKLDGDEATHFSAIIDFTLTAGQRKQLDVSLRPSARVRGVISDNVPRPVRHGRIKADTLNPNQEDYQRVSWFSWVPIQSDGTFAINWPAEEPLQLIALCDGFIARSGDAPDVVKNPPGESDPFQWPQVYGPDPEKRIELEMIPLTRCVATVIDGDEKPIAGVSVVSWPNVAWWNGGSQIYCHPLVRSERWLRERDYLSAADNTLPQPFQAISDAAGKATLELPEGNKRLAVMSDIYELPVFLGHRDVRVKLTAGEATEITLRLQPRGTEQLGEWDKLAGVVFGCSTREGRRICALPGVQKQMDEFQQRFREAKNQRDPQLLSEAYTVVADAFVGVGDLIEAEKWRQKAAAQAAKARGSN